MSQVTEGTRPRDDLQSRELEDTAKRVTALDIGVSNGVVAKVHRGWAALIQITTNFAAHQSPGVTVPDCLWTIGERVCVSQY